MNKRVCDRCPTDEEKPAVDIVWLRSAAGQRARLDICEEHLALLFAEAPSANGARPPQATPGPRPPQSDTKMAAARAIVSKLLAKHQRIDTILLADAIKRTTGSIAPEHFVHSILQDLIATGAAKRIKQGIYADAKAPPPPTLDDAGALAAIVKLVTSRPGIHSWVVAPLLGIPAPQYTRLRLRIREEGTLRIKGTTSAARFYPGKG